MKYISLAQCRYSHTIQEPTMEAMFSCLYYPWAGQELISHIPLLYTHTDTTLECRLITVYKHTNITVGCRFLTVHTHTPIQQ